jgi:hypothetical protein
MAAPERLADSTHAPRCALGIRIRRGVPLRFSRGGAQDPGPNGFASVTDLPRTQAAA